MDVMEKNKLDSEFASSLINAMTGTGGAGDSRTAGLFAYGPQVDQYQANALYHSSWFARKIVDIPADDMVKHWREFHIQDADPSVIEVIKKTEKQLHIKSRVLTAIKWARLFGGALLILGVRDNADLKEPLNIDAIGVGDLEFVQVLDKHRVGTQETNTWNPFSADYLEPMFYNIYGSDVHHSRVIKFIGLEPTYETLPLCGYFGTSVLQPMYETLRDATQALAAASNLTLKASQDVLKTPQLWDLVGTTDEEKINKRFSLMQAQRSILNMLVLDSGEEFESVSTTFSGLDNVLDKLLSMVVGAGDIPATRFFGESPAGMNATGESDMRNYYDRIRSDQENMLRSKLEILDDVMLRSSLGGIPDEYSFEFCNLNKPTQAEEAEIEDKQLDKLGKLFDIGVPTEVLLKDALEMGLSKNLTEEIIDEMSAEPDFDPDALA